MKPMGIFFLDAGRKFFGVPAVERLLEQIGGSTAHTADMLEPELVIRSTCAKNLSNK